MTTSAAAVFQQYRQDSTGRITMMNEDTLNNLPFNCPRCDWFGSLEKSSDKKKCPACESAVNPLQQKGLDNLRAHYRRLLKIGYKTEWTLEQRSAERERLERFFASIGKPL